ncbi:hypothetical protein BaRGS_00014719 [Batillaria attramentaria]|uniref:Uncharacterized protein n=1 Tax=Batillaria attramentaria TaxID=370345 RepID=A0ABD0L485_9CAEN
MIKLLSGHLKRSSPLSQGSDLLEKFNSYEEDPEVRALGNDGKSPLVPPSGISVSVSRHSRQWRLVNVGVWLCTQTLVMLNFPDRVENEGRL